MKSTYEPKYVTEILKQPLVFSTAEKLQIQKNSILSIVIHIL